MKELSKDFEDFKNLTNMINVTSELLSIKKNKLNIESVAIVGFILSKLIDTGETESISSSLISEELDINVDTVGIIIKKLIDSRFINRYWLIRETKNSRSEKKFVTDRKLFSLVLTDSTLKILTKNNYKLNIGSTDLKKLNEKYINKMKEIEVRKETSEEEKPIIDEKPEEKIKSEMSNEEIINDIKQRLASTKDEIEQVKIFHELIFIKPTIEVGMLNSYGLAKYLRVYKDHCTTSFNTVIRDAKFHSRLPKEPRLK